MIYQMHQSLTKHISTLDSEDEVERANEIKERLQVQLKRHTDNDKILKDIIDSMFSGFLSKFTLTVYDSTENAKEGAPEKIVAKHQLKSHISTIMDKVMEKYFLKQKRVKFDFLVKEAIKEHRD